MPPAITRVNPDTMPNSSKAGYSQISIVEPGRIALISGQVAWTQDGTPPPGDLADQVRVAARNARAALDAIGAAPRDIAMVRCYVTDLTPERLEEMMPALLEALEGEQPSLTGVGVAALAAPDLQVELEFTVRLPD